MGPRLTVPCPHCGGSAPAGIPRHVTLLAVMGRAMNPGELGIEAPAHVESSCSQGHEVHVYYLRRHTSPVHEDP